MLSFPFFSFFRGAAVSPAVVCRSQDIDEKNEGSLTYWDFYKGFKNKGYKFDQRVGGQTMVARCAVDGARGRLLWVTFFRLGCAFAVSRLPGLQVAEKLMSLLDRDGVGRVDCRDFDRVFSHLEYRENKQKEIFAKAHPPRGVWDRVVDTLGSKKVRQH